MDTAKLYILHMLQCDFDRLSGFCYFSTPRPHSNQMVWTIRVFALSQKHKSTNLLVNRKIFLNQNKTLKFSYIKHANIYFLICVIHKYSSTTIYSLYFSRIIFLPRCSRMKIYQLHRLSFQFLTTNKNNPLLPILCFFYIGESQTS